MNTGIVIMSVMKEEGFNVYENEGTCKVRWKKLLRTCGIGMLQEKNMFVGCPQVARSRMIHLMQQHI
jgi:hypothetical protein